MTKNTRYVTQAAVIAALYAALTHLQNLLLPGSATWMIQMRMSEALCVLAFFTPAAIPGLTIGCLLFPNGAYFFPFIFVEMSSAFIFALFLWRRNITVKKVFFAKFTVNVICNLILTSIFMKWMYLYFGDAKGVTYKLVTTVRVAKNLVLLPLESLLLTAFLSAMVPILPKIGIKIGEQPDLKLNRRHIITLAILFVIAVAFVAAYWYFFILKK